MRYLFKNLCTVPSVARLSTTRRRSAFTLVELCIVIAMIGILSSIASDAFYKRIPSYKTRSAAVEFGKNVDKLRMIALRNNRETRLCLDTYDSAPNSTSTANAGKYFLMVGNKSLQSSSWEYLPIDAISDSSDDEKKLGVVDLSSNSKSYRKNVSIGDWGSDIGGPHVGNSNCIVFSPRGYVLNPASDFNAQGFIEVTFINKVARKDGEADDFIVMVARSGFTRIDNSKARLNDKFFSGTQYDAAN